MEIYHMLHLKILTNLLTIKLNLMQVCVLNNAPITINGCKCVIKAELVTLRSLVITVFVSKRRGQLVKSNWQNVWDQD